MHFNNNYKNIKQQKKAKNNLQSNYTTIQYYNRKNEYLSNRPNDYLQP